MFNRRKKSQWTKSQSFPFCVNYAIKPGVYLVFPLAVMFHAESNVVAFKVFSIDHDLSWPRPCVRLLILHLACWGQHKVVLFLYSSRSIMATFWLPHISNIVVFNFPFCCLHWSYQFFLTSSSKTCRLVNPTTGAIKKINNKYIK